MSYCPTCEAVTGVLRLIETDIPLHMHEQFGGVACIVRVKLDIAGIKNEEANLIVPSVGCDWKTSRLILLTFYVNNGHENHVGLKIVGRMLRWFDRIWCGFVS
jgi:hypothetical protein